MNTLDHAAIAKSVLQSFESAIAELQAKGILRRRYLPIYGMGHSMGCKLHLLIGSLFDVERAGNYRNPLNFGVRVWRDAIAIWHFDAKDEHPLLA